MIFSYKIIAVFGVRTDNIGGKFGREFVVGVIPLLVLGEKFGLLEFAYVVIISARSCEQRIFAYRRGAGLRKRGNDERMVERAGRVFDKSFYEQRLMIGDFHKSVIG